MCTTQVAAPLVASAHAAINSGRAARRWIDRGPGKGGYYESAEDADSSLSDEEEGELDEDEEDS